ncbi:MAG: ATP synthase epsilon chain [Alphaproteobacteria bacterium]|nr:MAG: ATP synthase epsilon chain [Alphaproteobacteria bacterium]
MAEPFAFEIVSPERRLLAGEATEVVVPGGDGYFTVMAGHAPVMSTVKPGVVDVKMADGELRQFFVRGGFADVAPSGFTLLAEQAVALADLAAEDIEGHIRNAEEDLADADTDEKRDKARQTLSQLREVRDALAHMRR